MNCSIWHGIHRCDPGGASKRSGGLRLRL